MKNHDFECKVVHKVTGECDRRAKCTLCGQAGYNIRSCHCPKRLIETGLLGPDPSNA